MIFKKQEHWCAKDTFNFSSRMKCHSNVKSVTSYFELLRWLHARILTLAKCDEELQPVACGLWREDTREEQKKI
jgi:hypothetical protein